MFQIVTVKMVSKLIPFTIFTLISVCYCGKLPSQLTVCSFKDAACLKNTLKSSMKVFKSGNSDLKVPALDPFVIPTVSIPAGAKVDLVQNYKDFTLTGFSEPSEVENFVIDVKKRKLRFTVVFPHIEFKAMYNIKGKILLLDVYGSGPNLIKLDKFKLSMEMDVEPFKKSSDAELYYIKLKNEKVSIDAGHIWYNYVNLFDGNEQLGKAINDVLNDNWKEVFDDVKQNYANSIGRDVIVLINQVFEQIPIRDLFIDYEDLAKEFNATA